MSVGKKNLAMAKAKQWFKNWEEKFANDDGSKLTAPAMKTAARGSKKDVKPTSKDAHFLNKKLLPNTPKSTSKVVEKARRLARCRVVCRGVVAGVVAGGVVGRRRSSPGRSSNQRLAWPVRQGLVEPEGK